MKRTSKTVFVDDAGRELISLKNEIVGIECGYQSFTSDQLDELATAASAAADELRIYEAEAGKQVARISAEPVAAPLPR